jgi:hypothetical protein
MNGEPRTRVYLTVDIECAEERVMRGGRVQPPLGYDLRIWGRFRNQPRDLGIGLIMDVVERHGLKATFFTEALGAGYFGEAGLAEVCREILGRGHDVQLHCHPIQRRPDWKTRGEEPLSDCMNAYPAPAQQALLAEGLATLERCGVPQPDLLAFRAGGFAANNDTWDAMAQVGLRLSSSYDLAFRGGACKIIWPHEEAALFDTGAGVWELPITSFREPTGFRHFQVMAISASEMRDVLLQARALGLPEVCVVTHSFEYFYVDAIRERRLEDLCAFLQERSREFEVETVGALAQRLPLHRAENHLTLPRGNRLLKMRRLVEQTFKRLEARGAEVPLTRD